MVVLKVLQHLAMFCCFIDEHDLCICRAQVTETNEQAVDEGLLVMEHSRCMLITLLAIHM